MQILIAESLSVCKVLDLMVNERFGRDTACRVRLAAGSKTMRMGEKKRP